MNERKLFQIQKNIADNKNMNNINEKEFYQQYSNNKLEKICITNVNNLNNKAGITLIALVISIIVMLILAGVSLNATIGDNGIITQAQNATYMQSVAVLEEYLNNYYVEHYEEFSKSDNKAEAIQKYPSSSKWIYNPAANGYGSIQYLVDSNGKCLYLINKDELPEEIRKQIIGGDCGDKTYVEYMNLIDVYGVTPDLKVYYCSDGKESIKGIMYDKLENDNPNRVVLEAGNELAKIITGDSSKNVTAKEIKSVKSLTIDNTAGITTLKNLYNLTSLEELKLKDLELDSLTGIENVALLKYFSMSNCKIKNTDSVSELKRLKYLYILKTNNEQVKQIINSMKNTDYNQLEYIGIYDNKTNVNDLSCLKELSTNTKNAMKSMYINNNDISNIEFISDFTNLIYLSINYNSNITNLKGIKSLKKLETLEALECDLGKDEIYDTNLIDKGKNSENALYEVQELNTIKYLDLRNNKNLKYISYIKNNVNMKNLYLSGNPNFVISEVVEIKDLYNSVDKLTKNLDNMYAKYLNTSEVYNYNSCNLNDTSDEILALEALPKADKLKVKVIDLRNNKDLSDSKLNELLSSGFENVFSVRLSDCTNLKSLNFLEFIPNVQELLIGNTSVASTKESADEIKKIDQFCTKLCSLEIYSDYVDILDIQNFVIRCASAVRANDYYSNCYNYFSCNSSITKQLEKITSFMGYWRIMGLGEYKKDFIDLSKSQITSIVLDRGYKLKLPATLKAISEIQSDDYNDISACKNLTQIKVNPGYFYKEILKSYFEQVYNNNLNNIQYVEILRHKYINEDIGDVTNYLKYSNINQLIIANYKFEGNTSFFRANFDFNDDPETNKIEFGNLNILRIESCENFDSNSIKNCKSLTDVALNFCNISNTDNFSNLENLTTLDLSNNNISDLTGLQNLKNLKTLKIENNCLYDNSLQILLDLNKNGNLKNLHIKGNNSILNLDLLNQGNWEEKDW